MDGVAVLRAQDGRISVAGVTPANVKHLAACERACPSRQTHKAVWTGNTDLFLCRSSPRSDQVKARLWRRSIRMTRVAPQVEISEEKRISRLVYKITFAMERHASDKPAVPRLERASQALRVGQFLRPPVFTIVLGCLHKQPARDIDAFLLRAEALELSLSHSHATRQEGE